MSPARQITTTSAAGLRALGTSGQRSYELISQTMAQRFGPAHAALFAEPVVPDQGAQTDWYTSVTGPLRPLAALPPEQKAMAQDRLTALFDDIRTLAQILSGSVEPDVQRLAEALQNAITIPGEASVWVAETGDATAPFQPILVDWATLPDTRGAVTDRALTGWAPPRPPSPPRPMQSGVPLDTGAGMAGSGGHVPATPTAELAPRASGDGWQAWLLGLSWLFVGLLTVAVLYLLLPACGLNGFGRLNYCPVETTTAELVLDDSARQRDVLENRIAYLERRIAQTDDACTAPPPVIEPIQEALPAPDPEPVPEPPADEIDQRLDREDATGGNATIALIWDSRADIDLHVTCPAGDTIGYNNTNSAICSGRLDIDMNAGNQLSNAPVEHVYFTQMQPGTYRIEVNVFNANAFPQPHPFRLRVTFGTDVQEFTGTVSAASPRWTTNYVYAP